MPIPRGHCSIWEQVRLASFWITLKREGLRLPRVILLEEVEGEVKKGEVVDLEEKDSEKSLQRRNVLGSFHPDKYGINPADYLL